MSRRKMKMKTVKKAWYDAQTDAPAARLKKMSNADFKDFNAIWHDLAYIQSESGNSYRMAQYLHNFVQALGLPVDTDDYGNMKVQAGKGQGKAFGLASHIDTVHAITPAYKVYMQKDQFNRTIWYANTGIGGDDKCGIAICLWLLQKAAHVKADIGPLEVFFFVDEEIGCQGSQSSDPKWYENLSCFVQPDRRGYKDLINEYSGADSTSGAFQQATAEVFADFGYKETYGLYTDVFQIQESHTEVSTVNISCGYHRPHDKNEYVVFEQLVHAALLTEALERATRGKAFPHELKRNWLRTYGHAYGARQGFYSQPAVEVDDFRTNWGSYDYSTAFLNNRTHETMEEVNEILENATDWDDVPWDDLSNSTWAELKALKEADMRMNKFEPKNQGAEDDNA